MSIVRVGVGEHARYSLQLSTVTLIAEPPGLIACLSIPPFDGSKPVVQLTCSTCLHPILPKTNLCVCGREFGFTAWFREEELSQAQAQVSRLMDLSGLEPLQAELQAASLLEEYRIVYSAFNEGLMEWYSSSPSPFSARENPEAYYSLLRLHVEEALRG